MPFSLLPTSFIDHLSGLNPSCDSILELGSGEGDFSRLLASFGCRCLGLERRHPVAGAVCDLVGDARFPPVRPGSLQVVVAANLSRHLRPRRRLPEWIRLWRTLLRPEGKLFIFEDDPDPRQAAQRNFRDLQDFLCQLMPESRGTLLRLPRFCDMVGARHNGQEWSWGRMANDVELDKAAVLALLEGCGGPEGKSQSTLGTAIEQEGIAPGRYWWAAAGPLVEEVVT